MKTQPVTLICFCSAGILSVVPVVPLGHYALLLFHHLSAIFCPSLLHLVRQKRLHPILVMAWHLATFLKAPLTALPVRQTHQNRRTFASYAQKDLNRL